MKIKYYLPFLTILFLTSCSEDESDPTNPSDQLNSVAGELNDDVVTMVQSEGVQGALSLIDFIDNSTEFGRISPYQTDESKALFAQQANKLAYNFTYGVAKLLGEEPVGFTDIKGVYEWRPDLSDFEKIEESDILEIRFPVEESLTNNGIFRVLKFEVIEIDFEELPTAIEADLSVDGDIYIDLSFMVNYDASGNPELANINLDVLPFALTVFFDNTQTTATSLDASLLLDGDNLLGIDVDIEFDSEAKLEPISISGEVSYKNLRIVGSISDDQMDNSVDSDPNDYIDLALFIGDDKAGDIVFIFEEIVDGPDVYEDYVAYVEYADGTQENLEDILEDVINELETAFDGV